MRPGKFVVLPSFLSIFISKPGSHLVGSFVKPIPVILFPFMILLSVIFTVIVSLAHLSPLIKIITIIYRALIHALIIITTPVITVLPVEGFPVTEFILHSLSLNIIIPVCEIWIVRLLIIGTLFIPVLKILPV